MYLVIELIVYADVLVFLNIIVDYFLLLAAAKITGQNPKTVRMVIAAVLGGLASLYIFLPKQKSVVEFLFKAAEAFILTAVCYGVRNIKACLKNTGIFFLCTCAYAGIMFAVWTIFKPYGMVINNSEVYFHISPTVLVVCTVGGYAAFTLLWKIFKKSAPFAEKCVVTVFAEGKSITLEAMADTGNSLEDVFGKSEVIITDKKQIAKLLGDIEITTNPYIRHRYRVIPCNTVSGQDTLEGFWCDSATVEFDGKRTVVEKPLLAVAKTSLSDDYNAIINPKILR